MFCKRFWAKGGMTEAATTEMLILFLFKRKRNLVGAVVNTDSIKRVLSQNFCNAWALWKHRIGVDIAACNLFEVNLRVKKTVNRCCSGTENSSVKEKKKKANKYCRSIFACLLYVAV